MEARRLAEPANVERREQRDRYQPADDVAGVVREGGEERAQVMRHEERGDRDRDDVVQAQRPAREERDHLVERVARERGGAAGFGIHRRTLGIRLGRQHEQATREHEHQRREAQRVEGDQAERVIDGRADVAVGGGEQARHAHRPPQPVLGETRHRYTPRPGSGRIASAASRSRAARAQTTASVFTPSG